MYNAPENFWNSTWNASRSISIRVVIAGTISGNAELTNNKIANISFDDSMSSDNKLEIGSAYSKTFNFTFFDENGTVSAIGLGGASLDVYFTVDSIEVYYGRYYIDEVYISNYRVSCQCVDAMVKMDADYVTSATFPMSLYLLAQNVCSVAGITFLNDSLINGDIMINSVPEGLTCRQVIQYIAQLAGGSARIARGTGANLEIVYYTETNKIVPKSGAFAIDRAESAVTITGISYKEIYVVGAEGYLLSLSENPLIAEYEGTNTLTQILTNIYNIYDGFTYYPVTAKINSCFAFDSGDRIALTQKDNTTFSTIITHISFSNLSVFSLKSAGETVEQNKYVSKGKITSSVSELLKHVSTIENESLPSLSQAIIDASETLTTAISGYFYIPAPGNEYGLASGQAFLLDAENPLEASKVWRFNINGVGYSATGINGPYGIAITMDGKINASYITTGILSANFVRTGILSSENGETWINLNDGTFNLGDKVKYDGDKFSIDSYYRGGCNLLYGTAAYSLDNWETSGSVTTIRNNITISDNTESGGAFLLGGGIASELKQTVKTIPGGMYCWMIRYKLTGAVTGAASITIQNAETALSATDDWTLVQGQFTANSPATTLNIKNTNGYLYVGDLVIIAGSEINAWQQAQNEIMTNGMSFANGKLKINGNENDPLETEMTNSAVRVVDSATGDIMWRISVGGVELDQTVIHKKLTVEPETGSKAFAAVPQGDGHIYFVIND